MPEQKQTPESCGRDGTHFVQQGPTLLQKELQETIFLSTKESARKATFLLLIMALKSWEISTKTTTYLVISGVENLITKIDSNRPPLHSTRKNTMTQIIKAKYFLDDQDYGRPLLAREGLSH